MGKNLERKFKGGRGIISIPILRLNNQIEIPYCSYPKHPGVITKGRMEYKECLGCKYFLMYTSRSKT